MNKMKSGVKTPTTEQVAAALQKNKGFQNLAAKDLRVSTAWISHKINSTPELKQLRDDFGEIQLDSAELSLQTRIDEKSDTCLIFFLRTKGRKRGYCQEESHENNYSAIKHFLEMQRLNTPLDQDN